MKNEKLRIFGYTTAVFIIIMFLWWFQGGHIVSFLGPKPAPSDIVVVGTANALKAGGANVVNAIKGIFR